jgi:hypothetical protein
MERGSWGKRGGVAGDSRKKERRSLGYQRTGRGVAGNSREDRGA